MQPLFSMNPQDMSTNALFTEYIAVVNQVIGQNRNEFPYSAVIKAGEKFYGDRDIGVAVYKDDPQHPHDHFTLRLSGGTFGIEDFGKKDGAEVMWKIPTSHLHNVVSDPERFKQQPARLDLDWLLERMGIETKGTRTEARAS